MADGASDALIQAIGSMTEKMEEFSKIANTLEELTKAVGKFTEAVHAPPKVDNKDLDEIDRKDTEEEEIWEMVRDTAKDQEKETVRSWKDELNNLLVFAGLFSAVVTAFTVESYTWLQQDSGDVSNALLAQISLQLSRFTITFAGNLSSSAYVNSSAPALSLPAIESSFSPVSYAVPINTLWVLSLTLSLLSAFFAITVQQWLRQLHLAPNMPVRRAIQLLATRSDGLKTWQVPSIISLLPLLLQIAVILFLAGLFLLLQPLNAIVTVTFSAVALVGLLAFLAAIILPLMTPHCPYKSPLAPTVVIVFQWLSYPLAGATAMVISFVLLPAVLLVEALVLCFWPCFVPCRDLLPIFPASFYVTDLCRALFQYVISFHSHILVDISQFWLSREHRYISRKLDIENRLELSSLTQALFSTSARHSSTVFQLFRGFGGNTLLQTFKDTVVQSLSIFQSELEWTDLLSGYAPEPTMAPYINEWLSARHFRVLWQYFRQQDWEHGGLASDWAKALILVHEVSSKAPQQYAKRLLHICATQRFPKSYPRETVPACLLLDLIVNEGYVPDKDDTATLLRFTSNVCHKYRDCLANHDKHRLFLVAITLSLIAVHHSVPTQTIDMTSIIDALADALDDYSVKIAVTGEVEWYYNDDRSWNQVYPEVMSPARIIGTLCLALIDYATNPLLRPSLVERLQAFTRISIALHVICSVKGYKAKPEMLEACAHIDTFYVTLTRMKATLKEDAATGSNTEAPVHVETPRHQRTRANGSGSYVPVTASLKLDPNRRSRLFPSSALVATADAAARTDDLASVKVTETEKAHDPQHSAKSTDHRNSSQPPPDRKNTDTDPTAPGHDSTNGPSPDKGKARETPSIPLPAPKLQGTQTIQFIDAPKSTADISN